MGEKLSSSKAESGSGWGDQIILALRALAAATIVLYSSGDGAEAAAKKTEPLPRYPVGSEYHGRGAVAPQNYSKASEEEWAADRPAGVTYEPEGVSGPPPEKMPEKEITLMQKTITTIVEHFLNPVFRHLVEQMGSDKEKKIIEGLSMAIQHFDQLYYERTPDAYTIITKRPGSKSGLPDDFKIVFDDRRISEVNGQGINTMAIENWDTILQNCTQYRNERFRKIKKGGLMPEDHRIYDDFFRFNEDKYIVQLLKLVPPMTKFLTKEIEERSMEHKSGNGRFSIGISKKGLYTAISLKKTKQEKTKQEKLKVFFYITPQGHILKKTTFKTLVEKYIDDVDSSTDSKGKKKRIKVTTEGEEEKWEILDNENLFEKMYRAKLVGDTIEVEDLPEPEGGGEAVASSDNQVNPSDQVDPSGGHTQPEPLNPGGIVDAGSDKNPPLVGGDQDAHGCIGSAGYTWCEPKAKCLQVFVEPCQPKTTPPPKTTVKPNKEPKKAPQAPVIVPVKKKFSERVAEDPGLIGRLIDDPTLVREFFPNRTLGQGESVTDLINFVERNKEKEWAKKGINKLKDDLKNGTFQIPKYSSTSEALNALTSFYSTYFPDMPTMEVMKLGYILAKIYI